ncbi:MAG: hypothetical protein ABI880_02635 [Acidobacteriota bacterium]
MRATRFVSALAIAALMSASTAGPVVAGPADAPVALVQRSPSPLKSSIERAAAVAADANQFPRVAERRPATPRKSMQGGGGGGGMMMIALLSTAAGLAATYWMVKEMKKNNDTTTTAQ